MTVVVAGGTGFIGRAVCAGLARKGHDVAVLSRQSGAGMLTWKSIEREGLPSCDGVINLAGTSIMGGKWTPQFRELIRSSRVGTTAAIVRAIHRSKNPPKVFLNASGVGYYPPDADRVYSERDEIPKGINFLSQLSHDWEGAASLPKGHPTRVSMLRIGVVLGQGGGALERLLPPFKMGLGGRLGTGFQPFPWIHINDLVNAFLFSLDHDESAGVLNAVAPECITNRQFTKAMGKVLHRPTVCAVPALALRLLLGDRSDLLLHGQFVVPERLIQLGFRYAYPTIERALANLLGGET